MEWIKKNKIHILFIGIMTAAVLLSEAILLTHFGIGTPLGILTLFIYAVLIFAMVFGYIAALILKWDIWKLYVLIGICFSLIFLLAIPLYAVPDEVLHIEKAYAVSNKIMGLWNDNNGFFQMRYDDAHLTYQTKYTVEAMNDYLSKFFIPLKDSSLIYSSRTPMNAPFFEYIFSALGITVGRLLSMNTIWTYLTGRLFNMIIFIAVVAYSIKIIPIGKVLLAVLALMPMTIQQAVSFSYDSFAICFAFLITALSVDLYVQLKKSEPVNKKRLVILIISSLLMLEVKQHAYFTVSLLPAFILLEHRYGFFRKYSKVIFRVFFACCALGLLYIVWRKFFATAPLLPETARNVPWIEEEGYSLAMLVNKPVLLVYAFVETFLTYDVWFFESFIGQQLGWLDIIVTQYVVYIVFLMLLFATFKRKDQELLIETPYKAYMAAGTMVSIVGIFIGTMLAWSRVSVGYIEGVQGRYFIPTALMSFLSFQGSWIEIDSRIDRIEMVMMTVALFMTLYSIFISF